MVLTRNSAKTIVESALYNNDIVTNISQFLECKDLANLSMVSKQCMATVDAATMRLLSSCNARYGGEDDLSALQALHFLRSAPLEFDDLLGDRITYVLGDRARIHSSNPNTLFVPEYISQSIMATGDHDWSGYQQSAICNRYTMTGGQHYAKFTIRAYEELSLFPYFYCWIGVMRPLSFEWREEGVIQSYIGEPRSSDLLEEKTSAWGAGTVHSALYSHYEGYCVWSDWKRSPDSSDRIFSNAMIEHWEGMEGSSLDYSPYQMDKEIGLLLDLDEGTLTVYKNGARLGVMKTGLTGEYVWVATVLAQAHGTYHQQNVRIERAPIPGSSA